MEQGDPTLYRSQYFTKDMAHGESLGFWETREEPLIFGLLNTSLVLLSVCRDSEQDLCIRWWVVLQTKSGSYIFLIGSDDSVWNMNHPGQRAGCFQGSKSQVILVSPRG